jgi:hypothetical protein
MEKKMKNEKVVLFKTPIMKPLLSHFSLSLHTLERTVLIEREALSHLLNPKWQMAGERKGSFF